MVRRILLWVVLVRLTTVGPAAVPAGAEAVVVVTGDQHSAYVRTAQFAGLVDAIKAEAAGLPLAVLIDGDVFEQGNAVARRTAGEIDYAMLRALAHRAPTVLNLGNHEAEFSGLAEMVRRAEAAGVQVVGDIADKATGRPFAPAAVVLPLGTDRLMVLGIGTDHADTYRAAVRPDLRLPEPVAWAREHWPKLLARADGKAVFPVVLSHCGLMVDRALLSLVPDGTLFAGAHDHLRLVHREGRTVYFHSGSWNEYATVAWLCRGTEGAAHWVVEQRRINDDGPADPGLAGLIRRMESAHLTAADKTVIGRLPQAMAKAEAARWVAQAVRMAAGTEAAFIGNTTFGGGLPAGEVTQEAFDACVRFDGAICIAEVGGARLQALLAAANQGPETPFAARRGEFQFAAGPATIDPAKTYTIATTDWGAKNTARYFGEPAIAWRERPELRLKTLVRAQLAAAPVAAGTATTAAPSVDELYDTGKALFDALAPPEIKEQYEFPSRDQWNGFVAKLQHALENNSLEELAVYEPQARAALPALRSLPGGDDYADWLEERLDYIEAAAAAVAAPAPPANVAPVIPYLDLWRARMHDRPVPARAERLLPLLHREFAAEGVPPALVWLAEVESTFNPAARSPAGARGLFQLMPATAKELGLSTWLPDERTDPEKSAQAAARMLRQLRGQFGSWPLALAAYNAGPGRVRRALTQRQATTFAGIASALPAETRMYVPKVLATIEARTGVAWEKL
jgi:membrane-bound lytic murein transglycosylase D